MKVKDLMHFIKENNIPDDYEIMINEWSDGDYDYGWNLQYTSNSTSEVDNNKKMIIIEKI